MKNLVLFIACFLSLQSISAQSDFRGRWQGALHEVQNLQISFNLEGTDVNNLTAKLDVPSQGAEDVPCTGVEVRNDSVFIDMKMINGKYVGKLVNVNKIDGVWTQNGLSLVLNLKRTEGKLKLNRPQTPQPPFSYNSDDIVFYSKDKSMEFGATITYPKDDEKHPAIIMITGSGPQNRDEELFQHKPFAVVADHLTKNGYVVLRVDDRGVGSTGGDRGTATSADFAKDVEEAITYIKTRAEVDKKKIGLYGHSEGGLIAEMLAAERRDLDFIILMAAPGVPVKQLMTEQNVALLKNRGISEDAANSYGRLYQNLVDDLTSSSSQKEVYDKMNNSFNTWKKRTESDIVLSITGVSDSTSQDLFVRTFMDQSWNKWMTYFMRFDPQPVLADVRCKVLALNGSKDYQVLSRSNLEGILNGLKESKSKLYEAREIEGVNHLFQECNTCNVQEYGKLEQTIKPEVLDIITNWLNENVK